MKLKIQEKASKIGVKSKLKIQAKAKLIEDPTKIAEAKAKLIENSIEIEEPNKSKRFKQK